MSHRKMVNTSLATLLFAAIFFSENNLTAGEPAAQIEYIYQFNFDNDDSLSGWQNTKYAELAKGRNGKVLKVSVPPGKGKREDFAEKGSNILSLELDPQKVAGKNLFMRGWLKAENVSKPSVKWLGGKLSFHYDGPSGRSWKHPNDIYGTFEWTRFLCYIGTVPDNIKTARVYLGLQESTGTIFFDDVVIGIAPESNYPDSPPHAGTPFKGHDLPRLRGLEVNKYNPDNEGENIGAVTTKKAWNAHVIGHDWNSNIIRYQILWPELGRLRRSNDPRQYDLDAYNAWFDEELPRIDKLLDACDKNGMYVILNMFSWPGSDRFFQDSKYQDRLVEIWKILASRYKDKKMVLGYDILNEPHEGKLDFESPSVLNWQKIADKAARAIREIDVNTPIIVEATDWSNPNGFATLKPIPVDRVIYSVHMYYPHSFTHQRVYNDLSLTYPGMISGEMWNKERLRKSFEPVRKFQQKYNVHIVVGEFSAVRWAQDGSAYRWLKDVIDLYEEYGWDWCYHSFREYHGWSVEHDEDKTNTAPVAQMTSREKLLRDWFAKNEKPKF